MKRPEVCYEPTAADNVFGVAVCQLPVGHDGPCDGGELERMIGDRFMAQQLAERAEWDAFGSVL